MKITNKLILKIIKPILVALIVVIYGYACAQGQEFTMAMSDTIEVDLCQTPTGTIYDDGGSTGPYSNNFDGWVVLRGAGMAEIHLTGSYATEECCDTLAVYADGVLVSSDLRGTGSLNLSVTGSEVVIYFHTDGGVTGEGFSINYEIVSGNSGMCANGVSNLSASGIGMHETTLTWEGPGGRYHVVLDGNEVGVTTTETYALSGLSANVRYRATVYVEGETNNCCADRVVWRTACGTMQPPMNEDFNDMPTDSVPNCWLQITNFDDEYTRPRVVALTRMNKALMTSCGENNAVGHFSLMASPKMASSDGVWKVKFSYMASHNGVVVNLGWCDSVSSDYDLYGYTPFETLTIGGSNVWHTYEQTLTIPSGKCRLAFYMTQAEQNGVGRMVYIDDIEMSTCGVIEAWTLRTDTTSTQLHWTTYGSGTVDVGVTPAGGLSPDTVYRLCTSPLAINGLQPDTRYTLTLYPTCTEGTGVPYNLTMRTAANLRIETLCAPLEGARAEGWTQVRRDYSSNAGNGIGDIHTLDVLVSPTVSNLGGKWLTFQHWATYGGMLLELGTMTFPDDTGSFVVFDTLYPYENYPEYHTVQIPAGVPGRHLALRSQGGPTYYCQHVRNLQLGSCAVANPRVVNVYGSRVELAWDTVVGGSSVTIEYGPRGFNPGTGTRDTIAGSGAQRHMITGLGMHQHYDIIVYPPCSEEACELTRMEVSTSYRDYPLPYCEDFTTPEWGGWWGWEYGDWYQMQAYAYYPTVSTHPYYYEAGESMTLASYGFGWGYNASAVVPNVELDSGAYISFYATDISSGGRLILGTLPGRASEGLYHPIDTIELTSNGQRTHYTYRLPDSLMHLEQDRRLVLTYLHSNEYLNYRCHIDELHIAHSAYYSLEPLHVGYDSVSFRCQLTGRADSMEITLVGGGRTLVDTLSGDELNPFGIGGLTPGTLYQCFVRLLDGEEEGCLSYACYIITLSDGGDGTPNCFVFADLLSYELPSRWAFSGSAWVEDDLLNLTGDGTWGALMPYMGNLAGHHLTLHVANSDTLFLGIYRDSTLTDSLHFSPDASHLTILDTLAPDSLRYHILPFDVNDSIPLRIVILGSDTCRMAFAGVSSCPVVRFEPDASSILCSLPEGHGADYMLTYWIQGSGVEHTIRVVDNPFLLDGLRLGATYELTWRCTYDANECYPVTVVKLPDTLALPYCENFDPFGNGTGVPSNWTFRICDSISQTIIQPHDHSLRFGSPGSNRWSYAILPPLSQDTNLSLKMQLGLYGSWLTEIGSVDASGDTSTFIAFYSDILPVWSTIEVPIASLRNRRLAIRTNSDLYVDHINIHAYPLAKYSVPNSQTLQVTTDAPGDYYLLLKLDWPTYRWDTVHVTPDMTGYTFEGLSYGDYTIYQYSHPTEDSCPRSHYFKLKPSQVLPLCENFDAYYGLNWTHPENYYAFGDNNYVNLRMYDYTPGNEVVHFYTSSSRQEMAVLPEPLVDSLRNISLRLRYLAEGPADSITVGVLSDLMDTSNFTPIATLTYSSANWQTAVVDFGGYTGSGRWIAFRYRGNNATRGFYLDDLHMVACPDVLTATVSLFRHNTVRIDNSGGLHSPFYAEYGPEGFAQGSGTMVLIDRLPYDLTLAPETSYDFYFHCSAGDNACERHHVKTLGAPLAVPSCIDFDDMPVGTPHNWTTLQGPSTVEAQASHSGNQSLRVAGTIALPDIDIDSLQNVAIGLWVMSPEENSLLSVGTMSNPNNEATFHSLKRIAPMQAGVWEHHYVSLENAPDNVHFVALRNASNGPLRIYVDDLHITACAAFDMKVVNVSDNSITLSWKQVGEPEISIVFEDEGAHTTFPTQAGQRSISIGPITPTHNSQIIFHAQCSGDGTACAMPCIDTVTITPPGEGVGCVAVADLYSPQAVCFTGSYNNPYSEAGVMDFGEGNANSRHTVCYDTAARDPRTGGLLRTIPEGSTTSMRLGNWSTAPQNPEAEGVMYSLLVDTAYFDLLVMKYAAVLQDPLHAAEDQPRFRLELLDSAFNLIDSQCAAADFIANRNLGWNVAADNVLWKDWTTVGIDVSAYAGRQIYVRLTTYDCNEGSHYGYAYFTLECMHRSISTEQCGDADSIQFTAPAGFAYRWHQGGPTLSTNQSYTVLPANQIYYCDISFVDNPACSFTMSAYAGTRYPLALFDTTGSASDCPFRVRFHNQSTISADGVNPVGSGEGCESAWWDFGNGQTSTSYHATAVYDQPGTYTVTLVVGIADGQCTDTLRRTFTLENHTRFPRLQGPRRLCAESRDTLRLLDATTAAPGWLDSTALPLYAVCCDDILTTVEAVDAGGCRYTLRDTIHVRPIYDVHDTITVCPTHRYIYEGVDYGGPTEFDSPHLSVHDCDSMVHVVLRPRDTLFVLAPTFSLDQEEWHRYDTTLYGCAPTPLYLHDSTRSAYYSWRFWNADGSSDTLHFNTQDITLQIDSAGIYSFMLAVEGIEGCRDTVWADSVLHTYPRPHAEFLWQPARPSMHRPEVQLFNQSSPRDSLTYLWTITTPDGTDSTDAESPFYQWQGYVSAGDYPVTLAAYLTYLVDDSITLVCEDTVQHPITIADVFLQFPNLVTPNGDGVNDTWRVVNLLEQGEYTMNELWIYDHWGALVYHVRNIRRESDFWDPNDTGSPDATYYYRFEAKNDYGLVRHNGIIEVVR